MEVDKSVAIVIVNWNGADMLQGCLDSIKQQNYSDIRVIIVDNGSTDESVELLQMYYPEYELVLLPKNTGFATGSNVGIRKALEYPDTAYIFTLNNDTELYENAVREAILLGEQKKAEGEQLGAIATKMIYMDNEGLIDSVGILTHPDGGGLSRGNREPDTGQFDESEAVFGACGGAAFYTREMVEDILENDSFFDDQFFAYYEDLDIAWRAQLRGWKTYSAPKSIVKHIHSATAKSYSPFKAYHVNRNRFYVIIKNYPFWFALRALLITPMRYLRLLNSIRIKKGPSHELTKRTNTIKPFLLVLKGWLSVIYHLPGLLSKRFKIQSRKQISSSEIQTLFDQYTASVEEMIYK